MSVIFFMIGVSLLMALGFLAAFIWSMRTGQQDDLYTPALRILLDDAPPDNSPSEKPNMVVTRPDKPILSKFSTSSATTV